MYNLFDKYVYCEDAVDLLPRIALPCKETRAWVFGDTAARETTPRFDVAREGAFVVVREATARPGAVFVVVACPRLGVVVRPATARLGVVAVGVVAPPVRADVCVFPRGLGLLVAALLDLVDPAVEVGFLGTANTASIYYNVVPLKNATAK